MTEIENIFYDRLALQKEYLGVNKPVNKVKPLVSVVVITYQHVSYIRQCLDSILTQDTDFPFEVIIGEDGSTDGTKEICIEYAELYQEKIRLFLRNRNISHYLTTDGTDIMLNGHLSQAAVNGEYVAFCEGDDFWINKNKLKYQSEKMKLYPQCNISFHPAYMMDEQKKTSELICMYTKYEKIFSSRDVIIGGGGFMPTASLMLRVSVMKKIIPTILAEPILDYFLQIYSSLHNGALFLPEPMCIYRVNVPTSWTVKNKGAYKTFLHYNAMNRALTRVRYFYPQYAGAIAKRKLINWFIVLKSVVK